MYLNRRQERARYVVECAIEGSQRVLDPDEDTGHNNKRALAVADPFLNLLGDRLQRHRLVDEPDCVIRSSLHFDASLVEAHSAWEA